MSWVSASIQKSKEKFAEARIKTEKSRQNKLISMKENTEKYNKEANIIKKYEEAKTNRAEAKNIKYNKLFAPIKKVVSNTKRTRNKGSSRMVLGNIVSKSKKGSSKKVKSLLDETDSWEPKSLL